MINPTGGKIRNDTLGFGLFGSPRGNRRHRGIDFLCYPRQQVFCPIGGKYLRSADPYPDDKEYSGICIEGDGIEIKMFYVEPSIKVGDKVREGQIIGTAQNISAKYGKEMKPHIHVEISNFDPTFLFKIMGGM